MRSKQPQETATGVEARPGGVPDAAVAAFAALFQGYSKGYGRTDVTGSRGKRDDNSGKIQGKSWTERGEPTLDIYRAHLNGVGNGLGIFPLRDDDTVVFGAIDIDRYDLNHAELEAKVTLLGLPLIMFKSKSGGAHLYCFTTEPVEASLMRDRLAEYAALLGHAKDRNGKDTELFPKQSARFNDTDWGSWINLPYYNAADTKRPAFINGSEASLAEFLRTAMERRVTPEFLETPASAQDSALFKDGPPCLIQLHADGGFAEGTRNDGMMAVMVYLKKRWPDTWQDKVDEYNNEMASLPSKELVQLVKSNERKEYTYACKKSPINAVCQRRKCIHREYGIGNQGQDTKTLDITAIVRYDTSHGDEPLWRMEISGKPLMVTNSQFYNKDDFNRQAMAQANLVPVRCTPAIWQKTLGDLIATAEVHMMPDDAGPTGQLWGWIERFLTQRVNAAVREEIVLGKPWREEGKVYFRSQDLFSFLDSHKVEYKSQQAVWVLLHKHGASKDFWNIKGAGVNVWVIAATTPSDDEVPAVNLDQDDAF